MQVLKEGGNAFDAAIAVSAALSVVEPYSSGLGGGGYYLLHVASDGHDVMVDGRETAPAAASHDMYLDKSGELKTSSVRRGALSAAIPGTPAALVDIAKYARLPSRQGPGAGHRPGPGRLQGGQALRRHHRREHGHAHPALQPGCPFLVDGHAPEAGTRPEAADAGRDPGAHGVERRGRVLFR